LETRFSFRTRALDYLWAGLPIVATEGDSFGQLIEEEHLGLTVPPEDPQALEEALLRLLSDPEMAAACRARVAEARKAFRWSVVLEPLVAFCREPRRAPDLLASGAMIAPEVEAGVPAGTPVAAVAGQRTLIELARHHYREGGLSQVANRAGNKLRRFVNKL
jgi:hypothetical protein